MRASRRKPTSTSTGGMVRASVASCCGDDMERAAVKGGIRVGDKVRVRIRVRVTDRCSEYSYVVF